jgi:predicted nucleotidyltransferase
MMHQLTDEQLAALITWGKKTPEVQAIFLTGGRAKGTATPDSDLDLAFSMTGQDPLRRLATFLSRRRAWRAELEAALGLAVQLERARGDPTPEAGYVELWRRA